MVKNPKIILTSYRRWRATQQSSINEGGQKSFSLYNKRRKKCETPPFLSYRSESTPPQQKNRVTRMKEKKKKNKMTSEIIEKKLIPKFSSLGIGDSLRV